MCAGPVSLEITKLDFFIKPVNSEIVSDFCLLVIIVVWIFLASSNSLGPGAVAISILGCFVWSHHVFTINLINEVRNYFTVITIMIYLPTGTKLFNPSIKDHEKHK